MRRGLLLLLLSLSGCDGIFDLTRVGPPSSSDATAGFDASEADAYPFACKTDSFTGTTISQYWLKFEQLTTLKVKQNDELIIDMSLAENSSDNGEAGVVTPATYNFTNGRVTVELVQAVGGTQFRAECYLNVFVDYTHHYAFETSSGQLQVASVNDDAHDKLFMRDYDAVAHRFLRIESTNGELAFQTSADGVDFFEQATVTSVLDLSAVKFRLVAGTFDGGEAAPGMAKFDNYEVCVP